MIATQLVKYKGISYEFADGTKLIVPPLSLGDLEVMQERMAKLDGGISPDNINTAVEIICRALRRNYPDITQDKLKNELLDVSNFQEVIQLAMDVGGLKRKEANDGAVSSGEVEAAS